MQNGGESPPPRGGDGVLSATHRAGAEAAAELIARSVSAHTRRVYASALGELAGWLDGQRLEDASLAAYLGHLHQTRRAAATAALVVAAVRRAARDIGEEPPVGPLTRQALAGFRRAAVADARARGGQARGLTAEECAAGLASCLRPRRTGRGLERVETADGRGFVDAAIVALLFHGALRRSEVAALRWADIEFADGGDVVGVVTVRRSKANPAGDRRDVRRPVGACMTAIRRLKAATAPESGAPLTALASSK